jgi:hypothetical protein
MTRDLAGRLNKQCPESGFVLTGNAALTVGR